MTSLLITHTILGWINQLSTFRQFLIDFCCFVICLFFQWLQNNQQKTYDVV